MIMLIFFIALDTVEFLIFGVRTLTLGLEADVNGLHVAIAAAHLHFLQLQKVCIG
jgi:hypothetical protein